MKQEKRVVLGMVAVLAAPLAGCAGPRMAAPAGLAVGAEVLEVADRSSWSGTLVDVSFRLGPFKKGLAEGERAETSCLFAGLMLYTPPEDK